MSVGDQIEKKLKSEQPKSKISESIESRLLSGGPDDISASFVGQVDLGPPGLSNVPARLALADANTAQEKVNAFKKHFPEGDLVVAPVTNELLFRKNPSESFSKVDAGFKEKFEPVGDLVDFIGSDIGAIIGEIATSKGSRSVIGLLSRLFAGGAAGDAAQQGIQEVRGVQEQTLGEVGQRALGQGSISTVGGTLGFGVGKAIDTVTGGGFFSRAPGADQAMVAAERLDIPNLTPGQATDVPIVQRIEGQAGAALPTIQRYFDTQNKAAANVIRQMQDGRASKGLSQNLQQLHERKKGEILSQVRIGSQARGPATGLSAGGESLQKGIQEYNDVARTSIRQLYEKAREMGRPEFNISGVKAKADELATGVSGATPEGETIRLSGKLDPELDSVIKDIKSLDDALPDVEDANNVDQLRALRERLFDLKTVPPGEVKRRSHIQAESLYNEITRALRNPVSVPNKSFREAWDKANAEAAKRFDTLDKISVIQAAKTETPAQLAKRLGEPFQVDNLKVLRSTIPARRFAEFQDAFKLDLLSKSGNITKTINNFDKETLDVLMSPAEQSIFRKMGKEIDQLNSIGIKETLDRQSTVGGQIKELLIKNDSGSIARISKMVEESGGKNSPVGKMIRAGLIDSIAGDVIIRDRGAHIVKAKALESTIKELQDKGLLKFLTLSDVKNLADLNKIAPFLKSKADAGTSIQAAEAAAGARGAIMDIATGQSMTGGAIQTVLEHLGVGQFFTSKFGSWLLRGQANKKSVKEVAARTAATLGLAATDIDNINPEDFKKLQEAQ